MNLREGRIGRQETAAVALIACTICGIFSMNTENFYRQGNSSYISSALSAGLSLLAFFLIAEAMRRKHCRNLAALYRMAYGRILAIPLSFVTLLMLIYSAIMPLDRLLIILCRYVFIETTAQQVMLYMTACVVLLAWMGLEIIARTAKILVGVIVLAFFVAFLIAIPAYEVYRLYPLLGNGLGSTFLLGLTGIARFFPGVLALLICGVGVQGLNSAATGANAGILGGGLLTVGSQLCLGMTYPASLLATMHAPMYRLTMSVKTGSSYLRTDKLLLFFWMMAGLLVGGFYAYTGALLYAGTAYMRDIRPAAAAVGLSIGALTLIGYLQFAWFESIMLFLHVYAWALLLLPPMMAAMIVSIKPEHAE
ncbi:MAG: GerAB/ArcD/ProY family transporter [Clostridia bacterium]